jgi:uncharacterized protein YgiM (DUF1202 family)
MKRGAARLSLLLVVAVLVSALASLPAAAGSVTFTVTVKSIFLRGGPSFQAPRVYSVFQNQAYTVLGRTADNTWLRLDFAGATSECWILAAFGTVKGDLNSVPAVAGSGLPQPIQPVQPVQPATGSQPQATPGSPAQAPAASQPVMILRWAHFTVTAKSVYLRTEPNWISDKAGSLFAGQVVSVAGRSYDNQWIEVADGPTVAWVVAGAGQVNVALGMLPITEQAKPVVPLTPEAPPPPRAAGVELKPEWLPVITPAMRNIYFAYRFAKDINMFTVAGDCNSDDPDYLVRVVAGRFNLDGYTYLNETVGRFAASFVRHSLATHGGLSAATMFDGAWAHPSFCHKGVNNTEGPFPCELRVSGAGIVFLAVGTGDHPNWRSFEGNYRALINYALQQQVLPILVTKADDLEAQVDGAPSGYINGVIRRLAAEYNVPLMDFELATRDLPNHGLKNEQVAFHLSPAGFDMRTLFMLKMLDLIWRQ